MAKRRTAEAWLPSVVTMGVLPSCPGDGFGGHVHGFDEVCLFTGGPTTVLHAGRDTTATHGTAYLFRAGERHGYRNSPQQAPLLWVLHYRPDPVLSAACPALRARDPTERIWQLDAGQLEDFRSLYLRVQAEQDRERELAGPAGAAWLRLLLVRLARWKQPDSEPGLHSADPELSQLYRLLCEHIGSPQSLAASLQRQLPNYDSLRHRFTRVFRASPRQVLMRLRIRRAKNLLLEGDLPIAQIASRLGYARQHEFARAFHREVGCSPTAWRAGGGKRLD